jgi:carboxylesterase type B
LNFAFPNDPIVSGFIADSGSVFLYNQKDDPTYSNFTVVANYFNCSNADNITNSTNSSTRQEELDCLRQISYKDIEDFLGNYTSGTLNFVPFVDDKVVFANWSDRYALGAISDRPAIFGSNLLEGNQITTYPDPPNSAPDFNASEYYTLHAFQCPAALTSQCRDRLGLTTFRYQYRGNFSDVSPRWWEGAYHGSELPLLFGSYVDFSGPTSPAEVQTSQAMQKLWLAFGRDSAQGVMQHGWQPFRDGVVEVFGGYDSQDELKLMQAVDSQSIDNVCAGAINDAILSGENPFSSFS